MSDPATPSIDEVRNRLDEIVAAVSDESIELDEALELYEEAVTLGLAACQLSTAELALDDELAAGGAPRSASTPAAGSAASETPARD